jgi:hypothetical protein
MMKMSWVLYTELEGETYLLRTLNDKEEKLLRRNATVVKLINMLDMQFDVIDFVCMLNRSEANRGMNGKFIISLIIRKNLVQSREKKTNR